MVDMNNLLLITDDLTKKQLETENAVCLYPSLDNEVKWSISIDEYYTLNRSLTALIDEITDYLVDLPIIKIDVSREALKKLIRANTAQIIYIISDRLIRVLKFLEHNKDAQISLVKTRNFTPPLVYNNLMPLARDSWEFSQYLVNEILSDKGRIESIKKDLLFTENYWDISRWGDKYGFNYYPKPRSAINKIRTFVRSPLSVFISKGRDILYSTIHNISSYGKLLPIFALGFNEKFMLTNGFFWPFGKFCQLPQNIPNFLNKGVCDLSSRNCLAEITKSFFVQRFGEFIKKMGISNTAIDKYLNPVSMLFFNLFPVNMLEDFDVYYNWSIEQFKGFKIKHYIAWDTASSDVSIYYNCAATALGYKVWGIQHSAWGGYLANVPRIAEVSISGADYYITSGWSHYEPHLPSWKIKAVPMSSPHYSELAKKKKRLVRNRNVLLATGEVFSFPPVFYAGSFYVEILKRWNREIEALISELNKRDVHIILKTYAPNVTEILSNYGVIDKWVRAGGNNLTVHSKDAKGTAKDIFNKVTAVIWDMPSGGFAESILSGLPAFSLWNDNFIRCQPEADEIITKLVNAGIFNKDACDMAENVSECIQQVDWWNEPVRKEAINNFMSKFIRTNSKWVKEWKEFMKVSF